MGEGNRYSRPCGVVRRLDKTTRKKRETRKDLLTPLRGASKERGIRPLLFSEMAKNEGRGVRVIKLRGIKFKKSTSFSP